MIQHPFSLGVLTDNTDGIGPVTRALVRARIRELPVLADCDPQQVSPVEDERTQRDVTDETDPERQYAMLDAVSEAQRWDPVPGPTGYQTPESASEDEDDEGRSETEQLVDEGAMEAARQRQFEAARATGKVIRSNGRSRF